MEFNSAFKGLKLSFLTTHQNPDLNSIIAHPKVLTATMLVLLLT
jgi:hypothetical protein